MGILVLRVHGRGAEEAFQDEGGGHRWQRVPPNDKRGRVHTSTITVAVLPEPTAAELRLAPGDVQRVTCRGSGAGGQHRNVTESCVVVTHRPTGLTVRCESERSQHQNEETALALLRARLHAAHPRAHLAAAVAGARWARGCAATSAAPSAARRASSSTTRPDAPGPCAPTSAGSGRGR